MCVQSRGKERKEKSKAQWRIQIAVLDWFDNRVCSPSSPVPAFYSILLKSIHASSTNV